MEVPSQPNFSPDSSPSPKASSSLQAGPIVLETHNLQKTYRTGFWLNRKIPSLNGVSLALHQGETFGLLGPNGAGKTTLLKLLLGLLKPTLGTGQVLGHPLGDQRTKQRIGYLPENAYYYDYLTGWEFLDLIGGLFEIPQADRRQRIIQLLDLVGLAETTARKKPLRQYSKGMLQRIGMAQALINDPDIVFLDEPMSGLDPLGRYQIREIIHSLQAQGKTIFFNSHILSDVEQICDRVAILAQGQLLCLGPLNDLLGFADRYSVQGKGSSPTHLESWLNDLSWEGETWQGHLKGSPQAFLQELETQGGQILHLNLARPSLEDFFIQQLRDRGIHHSA
jgi:ABC-2 type transport system ATP-binding protein